MRKDKDGDGIKEDKARELKIPSNMYIWATMNSADQGVFPLDTAFKRRWDFKYKSLDDNTNNDKCIVEVGKDCVCQWGELRKAINSVLKRNQVNEDKLLSSSFVRPDKDKVISAERFKMKVLMYLWEDAARMSRKNVFAEGLSIFSDLMEMWDSVRYKEGDEDLMKSLFRFRDSKDERLVLKQREESVASANDSEDDASDASSGDDVSNVLEEGGGNESRVDDDVENATGSNGDDATINVDSTLGQTENDDRQDASQYVDSVTSNDNLMHQK